MLTISRSHNLTIAQMVTNESVMSPMVALNSPTNGGTLELVFVSKGRHQEKINVLIRTLPVFELSGALL